MKHLFVTSLRHHARNPVYSLITLAGFSLSITAALLIYLWVFNEKSYEKFHPGYDRIYRVLTVSKQGAEELRSPISYTKVPELLETTYPQVENAVSISSYYEDFPFQREGETEIVEAVYRKVSNDFFEVFEGFEFVEGSPETALKQEDQIVLSEELARKLFGDKKALGETLISDKYSGSAYAFTVSGVYRIPGESHLKPECLSTGRGRIHNKGKLRISIANYMPHANAKPSLGPKELNVYIRLKESADREFLQSATGLLSSYNSTDKLEFQPLEDIHLHTDYETREQEGVGAFKYVWIFSGMALLIALMAALNFSTLSIARASERANEIGVKKVNGANKGLLFRQFMADSLLQTVLAAALALLLVQLCLPAFNQLIGEELKFDLSSQLLGNLSLMVLLLCTFSGIYPSLYLSSLPPASIFRKGSTTGSGAGFLKILVTAQFSLAIFFIILTIVLTRQINYIRDKDLGMETSNIVVIPTGLWYNDYAFKQEMMQNPDILGVSASVSAPLDFTRKYSFTLSREGRTDSLETSLFWVDEDFANTYQLEVVKGSFLKKDYANFNDEMTRKRLYGEQTVINETAERMLGFDDPIGKRVGDKLIVGVVKDFHFRPLHHPVGPLFMTHCMECVGVMNVRISSNNIPSTLEFVRNTYIKHRENRNFSYRFFEDMLSQVYQPDTRMRNICVPFSLLAVVIAALGILGMSLFSIDCRTREIGIRRVSGATNSDILVLLNKAFTKWVLVGFVIAVPISWMVLHRWLQSFTYKTALSWWIFAAAGAIALCVALVSINWQSWQAALKNPVDTLRHRA